MGITEYVKCIKHYKALYKYQVLLLHGIDVITEVWDLKTQWLDGKHDENKSN